MEMIKDIRGKYQVGFPRPAGIRNSKSVEILAIKTGDGSSQGVLLSI